MLSCTHVSREYTGYRSRLLSASILSCVASGVMRSAYKAEVARQWQTEADRGRQRQTSQTLDRGRQRQTERGQREGRHADRHTKHIQSIPIAPNSILIASLFAAAL
jgi:hypothetical protein